MKPELISFDAAGTLIDVRWKPGPFAVSCAIEAGLRLDEQVAREAYERLLQTRWREYCQINLGRNEEACDEFWAQLTRDWVEQLDYGAGQADALVKIARERLYGPDQVLFSLYEDVVPTLQGLQQEGFRMVIISNWDYSLHRILRNLAITDFFEHVFASLEYGPEKPDPALFNIVSETTAVRLAAILHVGDHPLDDLEGARGAGMQALLLDRSRAGMQLPFISSLLDVSKVLQCGP